MENPEQTPAGTPAASGFTMPEKFVGKSAEDIVRSYQELESQYGKVSGLQNQLEQYGGLDNLRQWAQYGYQSSQQPRHEATQPTAAPAGNGEEFYANWEYLSPREQAQKLAQVVAGAAQRYVDDVGRQFTQRWQQDNETWRNQVNRQWEIYRTVMGEWRKNPKLDPDALLKGMAEVATGDLNTLVSIAAKSLTGGDEAETRAKTLFEAFKSDYEQQQRNQQMQTLSGVSGGTFALPEGAPSADNENTAIAKKLLESGVIQPGHF